jgi:hypothetical protein
MSGQSIVCHQAMRGQLLVVRLSRRDFTSNGSEPHGEEIACPIERVCVCVCWLRKLGEANPYACRQFSPFSFPRRNSDDHRQCHVITDRRQRTRQCHHGVPGSRSTRTLCHLVPSASSSERDAVGRSTPSERHRWSIPFGQRHSTAHWSLRMSSSQRRARTCR